MSEIDLYDLFSYESFFLSRENTRQGIASALTNRLARAIMEHGKVPFYAASWANVKSVKNGIKSGFRPAWSVITAAKK